MNQRNHFKNNLDLNALIFLFFLKLLYIQNATRDFDIIYTRFSLFYAEVLTHLFRS
jgi:hypothetical protein